MKKLILSIFFGLLCFASLSQGLPNTWTAAAGTDTYTATITNFGSSYTNKIAFVKFANTNTGASTINITGSTGSALGAIALRMWDGNSWEPLTASQIDVGTIYKVVYNGSYFQMESFGTGGGGLINQTLTDDVSVNVGGHSLTFFNNLSGIQISPDGTGGVGVLSGDPGGIILGGPDGVQIVPDKTVPNPIQGSMFIVGSDGYLDELPIGTEDQVLTSDGTTASWEDAASGAVTSVFGRTGDVFGEAGDYVATDIIYTPSGGISATTVDGAINELDSEKADKYATANRQTASYPLVLSDVGKTVEMNVASANDLTVPANSSVAFPVGTRITVVQYGSGLTTVVASGGVTLRSSSGLLTSPGQFVPMVLQKIATDEWYLWNGTQAGTFAGTYTPTLTNVANVSASTAYVCMYMRVGNVVTVSGRIDIDPTVTTTGTQLGISLPVASNFTSTDQSGGTASATAIAGQSAAIRSDATNDRAELIYNAVDITNQPMYFTFTYQVL